MNIKRSFFGIFPDLVALTMTAALMCACGGTGSSSNMISGVASKGLLNGSKVCAYAITVSGTQGALIGACTTTDSAGNFGIDIGNYNGPALFQATAGSYVDEATGKTILLASPLSSLVTNVTRGAGVAVTALTELAYQNASTLSGGLSSANMQTAITKVQNNFGVADIVNTMPVDALNVPASATTAQKNYALALASISQYLNGQTGTTLASALQTMQACLAAPTTACGAGSTSVGTLMSTALNTFVINHTAFAGTSGSTGRVVFFGSVTTLPSDGTNGATGATGLTGATGATGLTGATGTTGVAGTAGTTGATGLAGATGLIGATGASGVAGVAGATGATGLTGLTGATGVAGAAGTTGTTGLAGARGLTGATGATGLTGTTGSTGLTGTTGSTGVAGAIGLTGATGTSGVAGVAGATGATGLTGATGITGAAGTMGVTWVDVQGTSQQAVSNTGYLADSASLVTITLPASPVFGDVIQVNGVGSGGWTIVQNSGQSTIIKNILGSLSNSTTDAITGAQYDAIELQYIGSNTYSVLNYVGTVSALPSGYIHVNGLTWMPMSGRTINYGNAEIICSQPIYGQYGWRLPTLSELEGLYQSQLMLGHGWLLRNTWTSTVYPFDSDYTYVVDLNSGDYYHYISYNSFNFTCVR